MKACLLVLTLIASLSAQAMEVGRIKNNAGGAIVLRDNKCPDNGGNYAYGYSADSSETIQGCYFLEDGAIFVVWSHDKKLRRYDIDALQLSEEFAKKMKNQKPAKTY